jgi:translocating chain-associated membrane protein 1
MTYLNFSQYRIAALAAVCLLQAWLMWNFITFQLKRMREQAPIQPVARKPKQEKKSSSKKKKEERKLLVHTTYFSFLTKYY